VSSQAFVATQRCGKHLSAALPNNASVNTAITQQRPSCVSRLSDWFLGETAIPKKLHPCGGGVEYLHSDPASRRRRRKGKSQIWDSKIWSRDSWGSDPRKTALAKASSIYKRQTRPLLREGAPQNQVCTCQTVITVWSWAPDGARHQDWLTVSRNVTTTFFCWASIEYSVLSWSLAVTTCQ
jgi:hypothetical protein